MNGPEANRSNILIPSLASRSWVQSQCSKAVEQLVVQLEVLQRPHWQHYIVHSPYATDLIRSMTARSTVTLYIPSSVGTHAGTGVCPFNVVVKVLLPPLGRQGPLRVLSCHGPEVKTLVDSAFGGSMSGYFVLSSRGTQDPADMLSGQHYSFTLGLVLGSNKPVKKGATKMQLTGACAPAYQYTGQDPKGCGPI